MAASQVLQTLVVRLTLNASNYTTGLNTALMRAQTFGQQMSTIGVFLTRSVTLPLTVMGGVAVNEFAKFDKAMTKSLSIMEGVSESMKKEMESQAKVLGSTTVNSADKVADAYYDLAQSGMTAQEAMAALSLTNNFAIAGMFDMSKATDILTDAQAALGLVIRDNAAANAANMQYLSDILVKGSSQANASVEQLSEALVTKSAASMRFFNISVEEGVAVLSAYADMGKKGSEGGNLYDRALRLLAETVQTSKDIHDQFGFSVYNATDGLIHMADVVDNLDQILAGLSPEQRAATLSLLGFKARSQQAITPLLGMGDAIRKYKSGLQDVTLYTDSVAKKVQSGFIAQMTIFWNKTKVVAAEIGERLVPAIKLLTGMLDMALTAWEALPSPMQHVVVYLGLAAAAAGPFILACATMTTALHGLIAQLGLTWLVGNQFVVMMGLMQAGAVAFAAILAGSLVIALKAAYDEWVGLNAAMEESQRLQAIWMTESQLRMNNEVKALLEIVDAQERATAAKAASVANKNNLLASENELKKYKELLRIMEDVDIANIHRLRKDDGFQWTKDELLEKIKEADALNQRQLGHVKKIAEIENDALKNQSKMIENMKTQLAAMGVADDIIKRMTPKEIKDLLKKKQKIENEGEEPKTFWSGINNYIIQGRQMIHTAQQTMLGFSAALGWEMEDQMAAMAKAEEARLKKADKETERAEREAARAEEKLRKEIEKNRLGDALGLKTKGLGAMIDAMDWQKNKEVFSIIDKGKGRGPVAGLTEAGAIEAQRKANGLWVAAQIRRRDVLADSNSTMEQQQKVIWEEQRAKERYEKAKNRVGRYKNQMSEQELEDIENLPWGGPSWQRLQHVPDNEQANVVTESQGDRMIAALDKIASTPVTTITFVEANL